MTLPWIKYANLALLILFPLAWFTPLLQAGLLPLFGLAEISVISGLQALWQTDVFLALVVTLFAIFAPMMKTLGLALMHFGYLSRRLIPAMGFLGKLAMADVFLLSLYIVVVKGVGIGQVRVSWGMYFFTACILASLAITYLTEKKKAPV